jgi:hypothetical protein
MRVYVHRNLNKGCWSILRNGKLHRHRRQLTLDGVEFRVRPGGLRRAQREGRRNVHAFAIGETTNPKSHSRPTSSARYYYQIGKFLDDRGRQLFGAKRAYFTQHGEVLVVGPIYDSALVV